MAARLTAITKGIGLPVAGSDGFVVVEVVGVVSVVVVVGVVVSVVVVLGVVDSVWA